MTIKEMLTAERNLLQKLGEFASQLTGEKISVISGDEFFYHIEKKEITICLYFDWDNCRFTKYLINRYHPTVELEPFIWSLLHEIGHNRTWEKAIKDKSFNPFFSVMADITENAEQEEVFYFSQIEEKLATQWAIEYAEKNLEELNKWIVQFDEAMNS